MGGVGAIARVCHGRVSVVAKLKDGWPSKLKMLVPVVVSYFPILCVLAGASPTKRQLENMNRKPAHIPF